MQLCHISTSIHFYVYVTSLFSRKYECRSRNHVSFRWDQLLILSHRKHILSKLLQFGSNVFRYNSAGLFNVSITALNDVSRQTTLTDVIVQPELTSLTLNVQNPDQEFTGDVIISITSEVTYEDVNVQWNFGDMTQSNDLYPLLGPNTRNEKHHLYNCGVFTVTANVSNLVSWVSLSKTVIAEEAITGVTINAPNTVILSGEYFEFVVRTATGSNVTMHLDYGDGRQSSFVKHNLLRGSTESAFQILYESPGTYVVPVTVSNQFSTVIKTVGPVYVQNLVRNLRMSVSPVTKSPPSKVAVAVEYISTTSPAPPTDVTCFVLVNETWNNANFKSELRETQQLQIQVQTSRTAFGLVDIYVNCSNRLSSQDFFEQTFIQAVVENLEIKVDKRFAKIGDTVNFEFIIGKASYLNYTYSFYTGHNRTGRYFLDLVEHKTISDSHIYQSPGEYDVTFYVQNGVSRSEAEMTLWVLEEISGLEIERYYEQSETVNNYGHGENVNIFPVQRPVIFNVSTQSGNNLRYKFDFGDNITNIIDTSYIEHSYKNDGIYDVIVTVYNEIYNLTETLSIDMHEIILPLRLSNNGPQKSYKTMEFTLELAYSGTSPCFLWEIEGYSERTLYGDSICPSKMDSMNGVQYINASRSNVHTHSHMFTTEGLFSVTVKMFNEVSNTTISNSAIVSGISCFYPDVHFIGGRQTFDRPMKKLVSDLIVLESIAIINCESSSVPVYEWQIHKVIEGNTYLDEILEPSDIALAEIDKLKIYFTPGRLSPGLYKVTINVSMEGIRGLYTEDYSYLKISQSPLVVQIKGGSARSVSYGSDIIIDGMTYSSDPDVKNGSKSHLRFEWWCRHENETFSESTDHDVIIPSVEDVVNGSLTGSGCFGTGNGRLAETSGIFRFSSLLLKPGSVNIFKLVVQDSTRSASFEQAVHVIEGDAPQIYIR